LPISRSKKRKNEFSDDTFENKSHKSRRNSRHRDRDSAADDFNFEMPVGMSPEEKEEIMNKIAHL